MWGEDIWTSFSGMELSLLGRQRKAWDEGWRGYFRKRKQQVLHTGLNPLGKSEHWTVVLAAQPGQAEQGWRSCFQEITEGLPCCDPLKGLKRTGITMLCFKNDYFRGQCGLLGRHSGSWKAVKKATVVVLVKDHEDWIKEGPRGLGRKGWIQKVIWRGKGYGRRVACMWKGGCKTNPSRFWLGDLCVDQG